MLQKRKIYVHWVPDCPNDDQCAWWKEMAVQLLNRYRNEVEGFLKWIIAIGETQIRDFEQFKS